MMKLSEIKGMKEYINCGYAEDNTVRAYVVIPRYVLENMVRMKK